MSRRRDRGEPIDGILLLDKPAGLTSNQALQRVKRLLNARKAGHTGSLDPAATGMLPLCFGTATRISTYLLAADKTYRVTAALGTATDTGDADGTPTATADVPDLSPDKWRQVLQGFLGESSQIPPMYSALKQNGQRLYELARKGEVVERQPRPIRIAQIDLLEIAGRRLVFRVRCSKGTYVRSLVEDIAARLGTVAHTSRLHREAVTPFDSDKMLTLAALEAMAEQGTGALHESLIPADEALRGLPSVRLDELVSARFLQGQCVVAAGVTEGLLRVYRGNTFLGIANGSGAGTLAPKRLFA